MHNRQGLNFILEESFVEKDLFYKW